jgi:hypothetical protein
MQPAKSSLKPTLIPFFHQIQRCERKRIDEVCMGADERSKMVIASHFCNVEEPGGQLEQNGKSKKYCFRITYAAKPKKDGSKNHKSPRS